MQHLDLSLPTIAENLALDEALLLQAESGRGPEVLRFWEQSAPAVVLGASGIVAQDVHEAACQAEGIPIARRGSGGGTVLLGPGCLCFSLILDVERRSELRGVNASYQAILSRIIAGVPAHPIIGPVDGTGRTGELVAAGSSDLAIDGVKVGGNAQKRLARYLLHHGTLLYQFALSAIGRFLKEPARQPEYRRQRCHADFVGNLKVAPEVLKNHLRKAWNAHQPCRVVPVAQAEELVAHKYGQADWIRRR